MDSRAELQQLFREPITQIDCLDPGYSGHASDVWSIQTGSKAYIVRSSRLHEVPLREFWWGCHELFGIDPRRMDHFKANAALLGSITTIPVPQVYDHAVIGGKEYLVVQKMNGETLRTFMGQSEVLLQQFGEWLAHVHMQRHDYFGNLAHTQTEHPVSFHTRLSRTIRRLVELEYAGDHKIKAQLEAMIVELEQLPVPNYFCPVFIDLDPSQFLFQDGRLSGVVDIEAYVAGPREFDFIGLEYILDEESATSFLKGYSMILEPPDIADCRKVYRYFYRLLGVQGSVDLDRWLAQKVLF